MAEQPVSRFQTRLPLILAATLAAGMFIGQQLPRYGRHVQPEISPLAAAIVLLTKY
jgi:hypothetical protein